MEDGEEPPMAVLIQPDISVSSDSVSVGVTVITGYLGAGKSTVRNDKKSLLLSISQVFLLLIMFLFY